MDFTTDEDRAIVLERLRDDIHGVLIVFTKADGTERTIRATLNPRLIPETLQPKKETARSTSTTSQPVFDLELNLWRSFRWDSIIEITRL